MLKVFKRDGAAQEAPFAHLSPFFAIRKEAAYLLLLLLLFPSFTPTARLLACHTNAAQREREEGS